MTVIHHPTNGAGPSAAAALIAEHVRTIDSDQRARYEGYLAEILGSLGMEGLGGDRVDPGATISARRLASGLERLRPRSQPDDFHAEVGMGDASPLAPTIPTSAP